MSEQTSAPATVSVYIDGKAYTAPAGTPILQFFLDNGIEHPHICYNPQLGAIQSCDTCMIEVNGEVMRACATPIADGMRIERGTERATAARDEAMDRILENHMLYCTVCDNNNGNCTVHNTVKLMGTEHQTREYKPKPYPVDMSHPFYRYDPNQCILCGRCVEACQDLQVNETLSIDWERERPRVIWDMDVPIDESSCVSCGHCVTVCPCNALMEKSMLGEAGFMTDMDPNLLLPMIDLVKDVEPGYQSILAISEVESAMRETRIKKTKTVCTYCAVGCSFEVWTKDRHILKIEPTLDAPVNGVSTCVKGKFGWDFVNSEERLTTPLIRKGDQFVPATWDEALDLIAEKLSDIRNKYGADSLGFISSSKVSNEENYLMQKLARSVIGTNNVDNCSRYCQSPATSGLFRTVGYGGDAGSIKDIAKAGLVIIVGANTAEAHPVAATRIKRAGKLGDQKLIVVDLRKNEMAERADLFVRPKQGTDEIWMAAVAKYIIDKGWHAKDFLEQHVANVDDFIASLTGYTLEYAEQATGISRADLIKMAEMIHEADGTCILWAMGITQECGGSETSAMISNLLLVTGNYMRPGAGAYPMRGHNNVQGACDMGTLPGFLPGYQLTTDHDARQRVEAAWGTTLPMHEGMDKQEMLAAAQRDMLKGMYIMGEELAWVDSNANHVHEILANLEFLVVQDLFFTKTAQFADVILPAAASLEKDGTYTNTERRIQRFYKALEPLGESRPDWAIIQDVANRLGATWDYTHPGDVMAECASIAPLFAGVSYERLEGWQSLQWPVAADGTDTPILYMDGAFAFPDGQARLLPVAFIPPIQPPAEYDLLINNGRLLEHFHEGNMTNKSRGLRHKLPGTFAEISPELAKERGIETGALVRLVSEHGAIRIRVLVTDRVSGKEVFVPMNSVDEDSAVNLLTGTHVDVLTNTPAYKQTFARMEVLEQKGESPLPRVNHRFGHRNPQRGVEVYRKWRRSDYVPITDSQAAAKAGEQHG